MQPCVLVHLESSGGLTRVLLVHYWVNLTWSSWALPIMSEVICPSIPGNLLWLSNQAPGMDIWDKTGLVGTSASWPSCASRNGSSGSAGLCVAALSSGKASPGGLVPTELLSLFNLSTMYSRGPPSVSARLRIAPGKPVLAAPSSEFGVDVPDWFLLMGGECGPCPRSVMDFSPTWPSPGRFLPRLKQHTCYCKWLVATMSML